MVHATFLLSECYTTSLLLLLLLLWMVRVSIVVLCIDLNRHTLGRRMLWQFSMQLQRRRAHLGSRSFLHARSQARNPAYLLVPGLC